MTHIRMTLTPSGKDQAEMVLEALDVGTALAIADINVAQGTAELHCGNRRLARLTKHGLDDGAAFWKLG